jgi:SAM-dependent methyltransferase
VFHATIIQPSYDPPVNHWDHTFTHQQPVVPSDSDFVANRAVTYFGTLSGKRLLDIGCGLGGYALFFAQKGAKVTAIDTSTVAIETLSDYANANHVDVSAAKLSAFEIDDLGQFDLVFGNFVLHHLEPFDQFVHILRGVLVPGGKGFFYENRATPPLIWARDHLVGHFGIPKLGDADEYPLEDREIRMLQKHFMVTVEIADTYLMRLAPDYLLKGHGRRAAAIADRILHRFPLARRFSYRQHIKLT